MPKKLRVVSEIGFWCGVKYLKKHSFLFENHLQHLPNTFCGAGFQSSTFPVLNLKHNSFLVSRKLSLFLQKRHRSIRCCFMKLSICYQARLFLVENQLQQHLISLRRTKFVFKSYLDGFGRNTSNGVCFFKFRFRKQQQISTFGVGKPCLHDNFF